MSLTEKWKKFVFDMNARGIPVPTMRDPKTRQGSVSFTMVGVSFGLMAGCAFLAMGLVVNKWGGFFAEGPGSLTALKEAFFMAFQMSGLSMGLYFGRKFQRDDKGAITIDSTKET